MKFFQCYMLKCQLFHIYTHLNVYSGVGKSVSCKYCTELNIYLLNSIFEVYKLIEGGPTDKLFDEYQVYWDPPRSNSRGWESFALFLRTLLIDS